MAPIQSRPYCFIYMIVSCLFSPLTRAICSAHFDNVRIKNFKALKLPLCESFFTPTVLDYTAVIFRFDEATETTFPVKSIIFKWTGTFFSSSQQDIK